MPKPALFLALSALIGIVVIVAVYSVFGSNTQAYDGEREVRIPQGAAFSQVVDSLEAAGILRYRQTFELMGKITGWHRQIKAGYYEFEEGASNRAILERLRKGIQSPLRITIPPGTRPGVVAAILRRDLEIDSTAFMEALRDPEFAAELESDTLHLFGLLLPETYHFYWTADERAVIRRLKRETDRLFSAEKLTRAEEIGLSPAEVIRLASIVEWEARVEEEKRRIAGVYLNRLRIGMPLQADPTVQYALMQSDGGTLRRLVYADYQFDHPFNTYLHAGLPPGPITNPAPSTIEAVLDAEKHDYLYMVADGSGGHTFSRTFAEHQRAARNYYDIVREQRRRLQQQEMENAH